MSLFVCAWLQNFDGNLDKMLQWRVEWELKTGEFSLSVNHPLTSVPPPPRFPTLYILERSTSLFWSGHPMEHRFDSAKVEGLKRMNAVILSTSPFLMSLPHCAV